MTQDRYAEESPKVLKPFCKYCLPTNAKELIAATLRECAAQAFDEAAQDIECVGSRLEKKCGTRPAGVPCDFCMSAARLRGKAKALREQGEKP